jgi:hypothetical protein
MIRSTVDTAMKLDLTGVLSKRIVLENTLVGWHKFVHEVFYLVANWQGTTISRVYANKGLLRFVAESESDIQQSILNRLTQSIAKDSALCCVVCGQHGYRRKLEEGWPCLCKEHYIEYANDEAGT